jgi:MEDS: MEthanogen/methylotroph, DcmR Sensory domain
MNSQTESGEGERMISLGFDDELWPAGTHMCMIFVDDEERRMVIAKFLQSGLDANEQVSYFADTSTPEEVFKSLGEDGLTFPDEVEGRRVRVVPAEEAYCPGGTFDIDLLMGKRPGRYQQILSDGYVGARVTGEMSWSRRGLPGSERLVEYEARLNTSEARKVPITGLCQYDARLFDGEALHDILSVHPMMIVHGQVLRNPFYVEPEEFLANLAAGPHV